MQARKCGDGCAGLETTREGSLRTRIGAAIYQIYHGTKGLHFICAAMPLPTQCHTDLLLEHMKQSQAIHPLGAILHPQKTALIEVRSVCFRILEQAVGLSQNGA